ncbi:MAG: hypothetical protein F6J86_17230 [Symploca sp. SIO1B1]|nr:hypothetical protein [Symploca sp. SIO1B1]
MMRKIKAFINRQILLLEILKKGFNSLKYIALTSLFIIFSVLPSWPFLGNASSKLAIIAPATSSPVGTLPGKFAVDGNGSATYTVPIEVPPGINGVQPNISLVYNSQQENGLLGMGWQLAGFSAIGRCGKTIATDGVKGGVNFDSDDRFCFDGQRLMAVSGKYGANGTEYHTERETWVKVISHTESGKNGPRYFTATTKDGHQMQFGATDDARILARGRSDKAVRVWALNKVSDRNGNSVEISYQEDVSSGKEELASVAFLGYFPTKIRYTGNSGTKPLRLVTFEYEDRDDKIVVYVGGAKAETTKRLKSIKTYVDIDGNGNNVETAANLVKKYALTYEYSMETGRSRLTQLEECDAVGVCLPKTEFAWQTGRAEGGFKSDGLTTVTDPEQLRREDKWLPMDVNGDGRTDLVRLWKNAGKMSVSTYFSKGDGFKENGVTNNTDAGQLRQKDQWLPMDVNGDGLTDLVRLWNKSGKKSVSTYFSKGDGFKENGVTNNTDAGQLRQEDQWLPMDVNGDGRVDLVRRWKKDNAEIWLDTYFSEGDKFNETGATVKTDAKNLLLTQSWLSMDVDGDSLTDLVRLWRNNGKISVSTYFSNGKNFNEKGVTTNTDAGMLNLTKSWLPMNVNRDGLTDLVRVWNKKGKITISTYFSEGNNFSENRITAETNTSFVNETRELLTIDVNGDNLTDVVRLWNNNSKLSISTYFSKGNTFDTQGVTVNTNTDSLSSSQPILSMDVNGNGETDLVKLLEKGDELSLITHFANVLNRDLLTTITNGIGEVTQVEYKPLTDNTVYTKGSKAIYPKVDIQAPIYVVSKHKIAESKTDPTNTFIYQHKYEGAKIDRRRGWLGFEKLHLIDDQNHTETTTTYTTDFPLLGLVSSRKIKALKTGDVLGKISSSYGSSPKDKHGIYKFWQTAFTTESYTSGKYNYTLKRTYDYDDNHQNVTAIADLGDVSKQNDEVSTCIAYADGTGENWWHSFFPTSKKTVLGSADNCSNFTSWNAGKDLRWEDFGYDSRMNLTSHSNWLDKSGPNQTKEKWLKAKMSYDAYGNITKMTDPLGNTSQITYESTYHTFPEGHETPRGSHGSLVVRTEYEPKFGIKTKTIDANGKTAMLIPDSGIDGFGRVLEVQGIKPDSNDLVTLSKSELSKGEEGPSIKTQHRTQWQGDNSPNDTWLWEQEYIDGLGRTYKGEAKGYGGKTIANKLEFNPVGQVAKQYLPYYTGDAENFFAHEYNVRGNVIKTTNPVDAIDRVDYDRFGDARKVTYYYPNPRDNANGNNAVSSLVENTSRGWTKKKTAPDGSSASYTYDRLGQVVTITGPLGQETTMVYNSLGQVLSETTQATGTTQYFYNDNGKLASQIDAKGQKVSLEYDALGRIIKKLVYDKQGDSNPTETTTYEYDDPTVENGKGALTKIVMPEATYTFSYDNRGQVKQEKVAIDTDENGNKETYISEYTYDAAGRPDTITYPDGAVVRHTYNDGGELYTVALKDTGEKNFTTYATYENYNALGEIGKVTYNRNQVESDYTYDKIGRIATSKTTKRANTYFNFSYTWNKADKLLAINDNTNKGLNQKFGYNSVGRLTGAKADAYEDLSYQYDFAGNITKRNGTVLQHKADKKNQLADATYDANGNTTKYKPWNYTYDAQDRLLQVDKEGDKVNTFTYNDSGDRLSKKEADGTVTYYVAPLYEVVRNADKSQVHTKYIVGPQGAIAAISKNGKDVKLIAAIQGNSANLEAELYDPHSWTGLAQFLSAKLNQLAFTKDASQILFAWILVAWLLCALSIWMYRFWRSASRESWTGQSRAMVGRISVAMGWMTPETAERWASSQAKGWLLQTGHRPVSFALSLVAFSSMSLSGPSLLAQLTPGPNGPGIPVAGQVLYFHYDQLGSTTLVTDARANKVSQVNYEPYGAIAKSSLGKNTFRPKFTGKEYDSNSDLYYFGARYYNANLGSFLTPDPASQYFSPYVYGNGDPLSGIDPNGEMFVTLTVIAIAAIVGAYMGGAAVNHSLNPSSWNWSSGKTWVGIIAGAAIGGASAGVGIAAEGAIAAAGLSEGATIAAGMAVSGGVMGTMNASFTVMAGGNIGDVAESFATGFAMGALFAAPGIGQVAFYGMVGYDAYNFIANPSVGNGIQLGMDVLFMGMGAFTEGEFDEVGGCASFVAGTEVATAEGEKAIEEIAVGDTVLAYNEETGEEGEYTVTRLFTRIAPESVVVTVGEEEVETTPEHEFYTANGWVEAEDLRVGDTLVRLGGKIATVTDLESRPDSTRVYNFEVDEAHTYYVTREKFRVHNMRARCTYFSRRQRRTYEEVISATLSAGNSTGSKTNSRVRKYVNDPKTRVPDKVLSQISYRSDNGTWKKRYIEVENPPYHQEKWDAGHVVANQNGGSGTRNNNMFPQNLEMNRWEQRGEKYVLGTNSTKGGKSWKGFERKIKRKIEKYNNQQLFFKAKLKYKR